MAPLTHHLVDPGSVSTGSRDTAPVSVFSTLPVDVYPPPPRLLHEPLGTISVSPWGYCMLSPLAAWIRADWARHGLRPVGGGLATPSHPVLAEQGTVPAPWARGPYRAWPPRAGWAGHGLRPVGGGRAMPSHPSAVPPLSQSIKS